eukprot:403354693
MGLTAEEKKKKSDAAPAQMVQFLLSFNINNRVSYCYVPLMRNKQGDEICVVCETNYRKDGVQPKPQEQIKPANVQQVKADLPTMQSINETAESDEFEQYEQSDYLKAAREKLLQKHQAKKEVQQAQPQQQKQQENGRNVSQNNQKADEGVLNSKVNSYKAMIQSQPAYKEENQMKPFSAISGEEFENYKVVVFNKIQSLLKRLDSEQDLEQMKKVLDTIEHFRKVYSQL